MKSLKPLLLVILKIAAILFVGYQGLVILVWLVFVVPFLLAPVDWEQRQVYLRNRSPRALQVAYTVPQHALRFDTTYQKVGPDAVTIAVVGPVNWRPNSSYATRALDEAFRKWQYQQPDSIRLTLHVKPGEEVLLASRRTQVSGGYPDRGRSEEMILSSVLVQWQDSSRQGHSHALTPGKWLTQYAPKEAIGDEPNHVHYFDYR